MGLKIVTAKNLLRFKADLETYYFNVINAKLDKKVDDDVYASNSSYGIVRVDGKTILSDNGIISAAYSGGVSYSSEEQSTGLKWIDNTTVFQQTISLDTSLNYTSGEWVDVIDSPTDAIGIVDVTVYNTSNKQVFYPSGQIYNGKVQIKFYEDIVIDTITIKYTKATEIEYMSENKWADLENDAWEDLTLAKWKN